MIVVLIVEILSHKLSSAITVAYLRRTQSGGLVNGVTQIRVAVGVGFNQYDVAVRTDRGNHVEVETLFDRPARPVGTRRIAALSGLIDLLEAAVGGGAGRQSELRTVNLEIFL